MAMGIESSSMEEGAEVLPARPVPPRQPPGLLTTLIKPQLLSNLVASYPVLELSILIAMTVPRLMVPCQTGFTAPPPNSDITEDTSSRLS